MLPGGEFLPRCRNDRADPVGDHRQRSGGGDGRILLAQGACSRVTGIGEDLQKGDAVGLPLHVASAAILVEGLELLGGEVDLATHLEQRGMSISGQHQGDGGDGAHVAGDILAGSAVAASRGPGEDPVLIGQCHGQPIDLDLGSHGELVINDPGFGHHAIDPLLDLIEGEDVLERVHALVMEGRSEVGDGAAPHAAGWRPGSGQKRMDGLQPLELTVEGVVVGVRQRALDIDRVVVGVAGGLDITYQLAPAFPGTDRDGAQGRWAMDGFRRRRPFRVTSRAVGSIGIGHEAILPQANLKRFQMSRTGHARRTPGRTETSQRSPGEHSQGNRTETAKLSTPDVAIKRLR